MKIDLYTYCYNDEWFMPFFLRYYTKLVDRITFIDNGSTDSTLKLIKSAARGNPIIRIINSGMETWDWDLGLVYRNNVWKESDYDYIMWADLDEIIYKPELKKYLETTNADIYQAKGFDMVSETFPKKGSDILNIKYGMWSWLEDKFLIWKPDSKIESITAHTITKTDKKVNKSNIFCLHYKYLGADNLVKRAEQIKSRVPINSYCHGINGNILKIYPGFVKTRTEYEIEIRDRLSKAIKVI